MSDPVLYDVADGVATITLNRPGRRNALSWQLVDTAIGAVETASADPDVRVVVLTGAGGDFCVGADLKAADDSQRIVRRVSEHEDRTRLMAAARLVQLIAGLPKPVVAEIRGGCAGGGLSLALACDLRYAADTAVLNTAFTSIGLSGDLGLPYLLTWRTGPGKARELMLLSEKLSAAQALEAGLLTGVVAPDALRARIAEITRRLAAMPPQGLAGAKLNLEAAMHQSWSAYLPAETERLIRCTRDEGFALARAGSGDGSADGR